MIYRFIQNEVLIASNRGRSAFNLLNPVGDNCSLKECVCWQETSADVGRNVFQITDEFISTSQHLFVRFVSDDTINWKGFSAVFVLAPSNSRRRSLRRRTLAPSVSQPTKRKASKKHIDRMYNKEETRDV